ncbi:MAG: NAD(P)H-dependent oxidoreductase subunit E, partial [Pseudomonadota bacterium]|nr:NAD(P)H-dependent oxidoreductase subunit E [Pseudomonadota bacterium]
MQNINKKAPGRRNKVFFNKGRQIDKAALEDAEKLLENYLPLKKDMLIEYLHLFNDKYNGLYPKHLRALSELTKLSMSEIYEVASFYAHFHILNSDDVITPEVTIKVCDSITCAMNGAEKIYHTTKLKYKNYRVEKAPCMGRCNHAPVVEVNHNHIYYANSDKISNAINKKDFAYKNENFISFNQYFSNGGYQLLKNVESKKVSFNEMISVFSEAGLRGLGGAGFPAFKKWQFVKSYKGPRLMCINADEGEPGTFKDRYYLNKDPHRFLEGTLIAARLVEAEKCYIYIRDEYYGLIKLIESEIKLLEKNSIVPVDFLEIRRGAGAYICGEESALIESVEGKRGLPRNRPPYVAEVGLFGKPTLVHNVETVYWIREIFEKGGRWFSSYGRNGRSGLRTFSVSGFVKNPGIKLTDAGITVNQLIEEHCGGMLDGHKFKGYL